MADLFADEETARQPDIAAPNAPLADRLRPSSLDEVVGQEHLTGTDGAIGKRTTASRVILCDPSRL